MKVSGIASNTRVSLGRIALVWSDLALYIPGMIFELGVDLAPQLRDYSISDSTEKIVLSDLVYAYVGAIGSELTENGEVSKSLKRYLPGRSKSISNTGVAISPATLSLRRLYEFAGFFDFFRHLKTSQIFNPVCSIGLALCRKMCGPLASDPTTKYCSDRPAGVCSSFGLGKRQRRR